MSPKKSKQNSPLVVIKINGQAQKLSENQAVNWLDDLAKKMPAAALMQGKVAIEQNPSASGLRARYYQLLCDQELKPELIEITQSYLQSHPRDPVALSYLAHGLRLSARVPEAIVILEKLCKLRPSDPLALNSLATAYKEQGDFEKAKALFQRALALKPDYSLAYWNQSDITDTPEQDLDKISRLLQKKLPDTQAHYLNFSAYRLLEKKGDYSEAFNHLIQANEQKQRLMNYQIDQDVRIDESIIKTFTQEFMAENIGSGFEEIAPIFIFGMPRSGTTLVEQILASHSQVFGAGELSALGDATRTLLRKYRISTPFPQSLSELPKGSWKEIGQNYAELSGPARENEVIFTDKDLLNFKTAGMIRLCLPKAKLIMVKRNPMDVGFGCYRQLFNQGMRFTYSFENIATYLSSFHKLLDHWHQLLGNNITFVEYETLVNKPKETISDILEQVGLEAEQACFEPHKTERAVRTLSSSQVRQPISNKNIQQWRRYATQLEPMAQAFKKHGISVD